MTTKRRTVLDREMPAPPADGTRVVRHRRGGLIYGSAGIAEEG